MPEKDISIAGFGSMWTKEQREAASKGGRAPHEKRNRS